MLTTILKGLAKVLIHREDYSLIHFFLAASLAVVAAGSTEQPDVTTMAVY